MPVFLVPDVNATAEWYAKHLGFATAGIFPRSGPAAWASLQRDGGVWHTYIRLNGVATLYDAIKNEPFIKMTLRKQPYGDWEFEVEDLNGYVLVFGGDEDVPDLLNPR